MKNIFCLDDTRIFKNRKHKVMLIVFYLTISNNQLGLQSWMLEVIQILQNDTEYL